MEKICLGICDPNKPHAGSKAQQDAIKIVTDKCKYTYLPFECKGDDFLIGSIRPLLEFHVYKNIRKIKDSIVFINHPFTLVAIIHEGGGNLAKRNSVILLSHDIDFLRGRKNNRASTIKELQNATCIIVHNEKYAEFLVKEGITTPTVPLHIFDYLLPDIQKLPPKTLTRKISFVGNLTKSAFIQSWIQQKKTYSIELIGLCNKELEKQINASSSYKGVFPPNEVPFHISGSFGLVWDGDSTESCKGHLGEYLKYNNPHKASLYLACGMPIIIWSQAALATFVKENRIGFLIDKLEDIEEILNSITEEQYNELLQNIKPIQQKITKGEYLKEAINKAEELILKQKESSKGFSSTSN